MTRTRKQIAFIAAISFLVASLTLMKAYMKGKNPLSDQNILSGIISDNLPVGTVFTLSTEQVLSPRIPRIVHQIVWSDTLTFRNYLSIISVQKILQPYMIILHTRKSFKLRRTPFSYNDWGEKLISRVAMLQIKNLDFLDSLDFSPIEAKYAYLVLSKTGGGMYVNINTVINVNLWQYADTTPDTDKLPNNNKSIWAFRLNQCASPGNYTPTDKCCTIDADIFPVDIMLVNSYFGSFARMLFYGRPDIAVPKKSYPAIPKIVHYVWFGDKDINYSMYLSFVSTQKYVKPVKIYIYVDTWKRKSSTNFNKVVASENVEVVFYGPLATVYQTKLTKGPLYGSHASDIIRADVLLRHGGIYLDWDVYWMKPVDDLLSQGYETIAAVDFMVNIIPRQEYPDTINMGVVLAVPGSHFISLWLESFKTAYRTDHNTFHAVENVYKIYEEHPEQMYLHPRLQIMCFNFKCHPLWLDNYKDSTLDNKFDFRTDVYSVHFTHPRPDAFKSEEAVRNTNGFFGDMARHIFLSNLTNY